MTYCLVLVLVVSICYANQQVRYREANKNANSKIRFSTSGFVKNQWSPALERWTPVLDQWIPALGRWIPALDQ